MRLFFHNCFLFIPELCLLWYFLLTFSRCCRHLGIPSAPRHRAGSVSFGVVLSGQGVSLILALSRTLVLWTGLGLATVVSDVLNTLVDTKLFCIRQQVQFEVDYCYNTNFIYLL